MKRTIAVAALFLSTILAANYVTSRYGMIPVGLGFAATAGTYFAGMAFVLRDALQDLAGKYVTLAVIAAGAALSFALSSPAIALASALAFALSEAADLLVYTPLRRKGYVRAALASNLVGAVVDSFVFLLVAGFPLMLALPGQLVGKAWITLLAVGTVVALRARRRVVTA